MEEKLNHETGLRAGVINEEVFVQEISLCRKLNQKNSGGCRWGKCEYCGVIPLLYKLHREKLLEEPEEIAAAKGDAFGI